jgi:hypothetical protein
VGINGVTVTGNGSSGSPYSISPPTSSPLPVTTVTVDTVLTAAQHVVLVDSQTPAAPVTITLPATHTIGEEYIVKDFGSAGAGFTQTQAVSVDPGVNNIDGSSAVIVFLTDGDSLYLIGVNGTDWIIA